MPETVTSEKIVAVCARCADRKFKKQITGTAGMRTKRRDTRSTVRRDGECKRTRAEFERFAATGFNLRSFHAHRRHRVSEC